MLHTSNSLRKVVLTFITRLATLKKSIVLRNGVDMTIFAWYFEFTHNSGLKDYKTSAKEK